MSLLRSSNGKAHFVTTQTCDMYLKGGSWGVGGCSPKCKFYKSISQIFLQRANFSVVHFH